MKRVKRCKKCKRVIREENKNGYCAGCASNAIRTEKKRKKCFICEEPCCGKLLIEYRKGQLISLCTSHFNRLLLIQDTKELREEIKRLKCHY